MGARKRAAKAEAKRKAARKRAAERRALPSTARPKKKDAADDAADGPGSGDVSSADVNLGHVMALRPRVSATFRTEDFRAAKNRLGEKRYETIEDAARAVAETALEITRDPAMAGQRRR